MIRARYQNAVAHRTTGVVAPHDGGGAEDLLPSVPRSVTYSRADFTSLRPPADSRLQEIYAKWITPVRAVLIFGLWLTYAWWRPVVLILILATLAMLAWVAIGGA